MAEQSSADYRGNLGRYALFGEIAAGGMATVHLARLIGSVGFARTVAIKRLHPHLAKDPDFVAMFLEEARLATRVRHPNVVTTLDVVFEDGELFLVMEYVAGESLSRLIRKLREEGKTVPPRYAVSVMVGALEGLHGAHEAKSEKGTPLGLVHRDISPQNVHVGVDGVAYVLDFGIAKATNRVQEGTRTDQIKGKVAYMSPEQLAKGPIDRRADVYSASVVLWEALTGKRLFQAEDIPSLVYAIINDEVKPPSSENPEVSSELDAVVMRGLDRDASKRWSTAREMAVALEKVFTPAPRREIGAWTESVAGEALAWRMDLVHRIESETSSSMPPPLRSAAPITSEGSSGVSGVVSTEAAHATLAASDLSDEPAPVENSEQLSFRATSPSLVDDDEARHARGAMSRRLMIVAIALFATAVILVLVRLIQLQGDGGAAPTGSAQPAESSESAIGIAPKTTPAVSATASASATATARPTATAPVFPAPTTPGPRINRR